MKVALTIADHLRRASQVYPQRTACVDEPLKPAASWGTLSAAKVRAKPSAVLNVRRCMQVTPNRKTVLGKL